MIEPIDYMTAVFRYLKLLDCLAGATAERNACCLTLLLAVLLQGLRARVPCDTVLKLSILNDCLAQANNELIELFAVCRPIAMNELLLWFGMREAGD